MKQNGNNKKHFIKADSKIDLRMRQESENLVWDNLPTAVQGVLDVLTMSLGVVKDMNQKPHTRLMGGRLALDAAEMFLSRTLPVLQAVKVSADVTQKTQITAELIVSSLREEAQRPGGLTVLNLLPVVDKDPKKMLEEAQDQGPEEESGGVES